MGTYAFSDLVAHHILEEGDDEEKRADGPVVLFIAWSETQVRATLCWGEVGKERDAVSSVTDRLGNRILEEKEKRERVNAMP